MGDGSILEIKDIDKWFWSMRSCSPLASTGWRGDDSIMSKIAK